MEPQMRKNSRPFAWAVDILRRANLRPTRQRMGLVRLLFEHGNRHVSAEELFKEAKNAGISLSLATVYNTLNQFRDVGIMREIVTGGGRTFYDTNVKPHGHIFYEDSGCVEDVSENMIAVQVLPDFPDHLNVSDIEILVRVRGGSV